MKFSLGKFLPCVIIILQTFEGVAKMFLKLSKPNQQVRPTVKKVGELVDLKKHKEKKYISLMIVPSYSGGKTRSLHVPHTVFYGTVLFFLAIAAMVGGLYLKSIHFENMTYTLGYVLEETRENFDEFRVTAEHLHTYLYENSADIYDRLNNEQHRVRAEFFRQEVEHLGDFEFVQAVVYGMERQVLAFETERVEFLAYLSKRARQIPYIASTVRRIAASQEALAYELFGDTETAPPALDTRVLGARTHNTEAELHARLEVLAHELEIAMLLFEHLEIYRSEINDYLRNFPTLMPVAGGVVTSGFGTRRDPITGRPAFHEGVDIPAPTGTPILAAGGGTVSYSGWRGGYGNVVFIDHGFGLQTRYAHNSQNLVAAGERVERGQVIAYVGSTGRSLSPHLHYEVLRNGSPTDPVPFLLDN
jgi:murein DD-endopeptidase MepM/ murein hydrolase activator NlpD